MFKIIELEKIVSGKNIRNERDEEINDLAKSIEENGLINPIFVKPLDNGKFEVIAGHRRFEACKRLRLPYIECNVSDDDLGDKDVVFAQIAENVQRKDMSAQELVDLCDDLKARYGIKQNQLAKIFNKHESWISNQYQAVRILNSIYGGNIPDDMKNKTAGQIKLLAKKMTSGEDQKILCKGMSVKIKGHKFTITCSNNATENALMEFINKRKL